MSEQQVKETYPRLTEDHTKAEIVEHLRRAHYGGNSFHIRGEVVARYDTKVTKDRLLRHHENLHKVLDSDVRQKRNGLFVLTNAVGQTTATAHMPAVDHVHDALVVSDEVREQARRVRNNEPVADKPLSAQERKVLTELVNNDFAALKSEMRAFAADAMVQKRSEVEAEWQERIAKAAGLVAKANEVSRKHAAEVQAMKDKHAAVWEDIHARAGVDGLVLSQQQATDSAGRTVVTYKADAVGRREALKEAEIENQRFLDRALMTLERQRLDAQRRVLVSGVSKEAAGILDAIPDAKTMMVEAQRGSKQITS